MKGGGQLHVHAALTPGETASVTFCTGRWVGPRDGLEAMEKRKVSCPCQKLNPESWILHPVAQTLYRPLPRSFP
jgi:hypothetical protein